MEKFILIDNGDWKVINTSEIKYIKTRYIFTKCGRESVGANILTKEGQVIESDESVLSIYQKIIDAQK